ncbi:DsrE family protein [Halalkalirubrum salinum]|uniref:DsrE family protein n=1 Tax=Halalkalirubrum salinum TaxID=2563889 RepID=UPI0010FB5611|nr:DsrE family protein [Halalkalirubrum salinum]
MKTVIHIVSGDETEQETALAIARNLLDDESGSIDDVAVVVQADGVKAIETGQESEKQVRALLDDGVPFKACSNTIEMMDLDESDLVDGVETVPEGAVEVTRLETEGFRNCYKKRA